MLSSRGSRVAPLVLWMRSGAQQGKEIWWILVDLNLELLYLSPGSLLGPRGAPPHLVAVVG